MLIYVGVPSFCKEDTVARCTLDTPCLDVREQQPEQVGRGRPQLNSHAPAGASDSCAQAAAALTGSATHEQAS